MSQSEAWYCKAASGLCSGAVLNDHKAVQCDKCEMWLHNDCSFVTDFEYKTMQNSSSTWICPKCEFFYFSDSFFSEQLNLVDQNRYSSLAKDGETRTSTTGTKNNNFVSGLKFSSINVNGIRSKNLNYWLTLIFIRPHIVTIQETKIDSSISTSELFPETCPYNVYRKDRNSKVGGVILLIHKDMPITEFENDSESVWVKCSQIKLLISWQVGINLLVEIWWRLHQKLRC